MENTEETTKAIAKTEEENIKVKLNINNNEDDTKNPDEQDAADEINGDVKEETKDESAAAAAEAAKAAAEEVVENGVDVKTEDNSASVEVKRLTEAASVAVNRAEEVKDKADETLENFIGPKDTDVDDKNDKSKAGAASVKVVGFGSDKPALMNHQERSVDPPSAPPPNPDRLVPSEKLWVVKRDEAVKIRMGRDGPEALKPMSVPTLLVNTVKRHANGTALVCTRNGETRKWTYAQYFDDIKRTARGFIKLGLDVHHGVCILGFNSPEWFISDLAAVVAGGYAVGIYTTNNAEACHYVLEDCEANICVVENDAQLQKILQVRDQLPHLRAIIQYTGELSQRYSNVYTWSEFMKLGNECPEEALIERISGQAPNKCCTLIYTSGTTGKPKGVMLSHDNVTWVAQVCGTQTHLLYGQEVMVSYLPLSHIAAQIADIYIPITYGSTVYFAKPDALKGTLKDTLKEARPTFFFGVPRVWEKMMAALKEKGAQTTGIKKTIAGWCKGVGLKNYRNLQNGQSAPTGYGIAKALLFSKVLTELGFDRCRGMWSAAAPISVDTLEFLASVGINIVELFGMSESTGPHSVCTFPHQYRVGSVGVTQQGCHTKIDNPDKDGNGELLLNGRHIFMGYLNKEEKTAETIDERTGWMKSGDIARVDERGHIYITGRIKEILITAGGENVAPILIEDTVKRELPVVSNAMLVGDRKKFLSCLLSLKTQMDLDTGAPLDELTNEAKEWCRSVGSQANKVSDILDTNDTDVMKAIQAGIDRANSQAISRAQNIQKWSVLPKDFSIAGGELGPTMKTMRHAVCRMYEKTITNFYGPE